MRRQCARPGCSAVATTTFTFDSRERTVWLDPPLDGAARAGELCARHTTALAPPLGWQVVDRRSSMPAPAARPAPTIAVRPPATVTRPAPVTPAAPVVAAPLVAPRFDFDAVQAAAPAAAPAPPTPPGPGAPVAWYPRFERGDSLGGVLDATTPLLARAFGNVRAI
jgi:hypothetical protein